MGEQHLSEYAQGLRAGMRQRAAWFHLLLQAAEAQGADIEKLTDDAIYAYGVQVGASAPGTEPEDLLEHMTGDPHFFEVFDKEIVSRGPDQCVARFHHCPLAEAWMELGLPPERVDRLCNLANKGDFGRASKFTAAVLTFPKRIGGGDPYCELCIRRQDGACREGG